MVEVRYYSDWAPTPSSEIAAEDIRDLDQYSIASYDAGGSLERVEVYDRKRLSCVIYHSANEDTERSHVEHYPKIAMQIVRVVERVERHVWILRRRLGKDGGRSEALDLEDEAGRVIVSLERALSGQTLNVEKYLWENDELLYLFQYTPAGALLGIRDFRAHDRAEFAYLRSELADPEFYESGFALPRALRGTAIPLRASAHSDSAE